MSLPLDWRTFAVCRDADPEIFFPTAETGPALARANAEALAWCRVCPVRPECRAFAFAHLPEGIAGGMTARQRDALKRHQFGRQTGQRTTTRPVRSPSPLASDSATSVRRSTRERGIELLVTGASRAEVARRLHVSRRTVDRWATLPTVHPLLPPPVDTSGVITRREARRIS